jgi:RimK family alpha-L-glutamate ligase
MRLAVVARHVTSTNESLVAHAAPGIAALVLTPEEALASLHAGDIALVRLDVARSLDGIEPGLQALTALERRGVTVLNRPRALRAAHDKLLTARVLALCGLPHPTTEVVAAGSTPSLEPPVVVKPRFGSWGRDVHLCETRSAIERTLSELGGRRWFRTQGALVQKLVPLRGYDLRVVVAGGRVVGAIQRVCAPGEWRTNIALGGRRRRVPSVPTPAAELAVASADALHLDLAGIDLLPAPDGGWIALEVNGAGEFTDDYALGRPPFAAALEALIAPELAAAVGLG